MLRVGLDLLEIVGEQMDITSLWQKAKDIQSIETYERFILGLDLLFCFGLIDLFRNSLFGTKIIFSKY